MLSQPPERVRLFRITHYENLDYILANGIYCKGHINFDPNYVNIGDKQLIAQRESYPIPLPGAGDLGEYVPFYFGPHSPMLLNIITGFRGIPKLPQRDIVYLVYAFEDLATTCSYLFCDGHAKNQLTKFYSSPKDLDKIDWSVVSSRDWKNTENDRDKMRRKQAEFLVKNHVPTSCLKGIIVYDQQMANLVTNKFIGVKVVVDKKYFY